MANVVITFKIMPSSPDEDLNAIKKSATTFIEEAEGMVHKIEEEPIAFGLKAVLIMFLMNEAKGSTEELEAKISEIDGVNSVEVTDVRRAVG
jgi:elongation factor 1-beta